MTRNKQKYINKTVFKAIYRTSSLLAHQNLQQCHNCSELGYKRVWQNCVVNALFIWCWSLRPWDAHKVRNRLWMLMSGMLVSWRFQQKGILPFEWGQMPGPLFSRCIPRWTNASNQHDNKAVAQMPCVQGGACSLIVAWETNTWQLEGFPSYI